MRQYFSLHPEWDPSAIGFTHRMCLSDDDIVFLYRLACFYLDVTLTGPRALNDLIIHPRDQENADRLRIELSALLKAINAKPKQVCKWPNE